MGCGASSSARAAHCRPAAPCDALQRCRQRARVAPAQDLQKMVDVHQLELIRSSISKPSTRSSERSSSKCRASDEPELPKPSSKQPSSRGFSSLMPQIAVHGGETGDPLDSMDEAELEHKSSFAADRV
ncbi:unnamed protein product [Durusdinium trenchii]|uniref:Uncharacterized protein n=1 Tax=Durusdinium trenchii TaxID=1381693 RepID=A0ABP0PP80_9DINO